MRSVLDKRAVYLSYPLSIAVSSSGAKFVIGYSDSTKVVRAHTVWPLNRLKKELTVVISWNVL